MKINNQEVSIEELVKEISPRNMMKNFKNGIYLSQEDEQVLKKYGFNINNYSSLQSLLFDISEYLNENYDLDLEDLEKLSISLSDTNYYQNTKK